MRQVGIFRMLKLAGALICMTMILSACEKRMDSVGSNTVKSDGTFTSVSRKTKVQDVIDNPVFEDYGRLIFPVDQTIFKGLTLENVEDILIWYNYVNPDKTVEIVNYLGEQASAGNTVFYDIYIRRKKKQRTPGKRIPDYSFFGEIREKKLLFVMQEEDLFMLEPCRTVFLMHWSFPRKDIMPLL